MDLNLNNLKDFWIFFGSNPPSQPFGWVDVTAYVGTISCARKSAWYNVLSMHSCVKAHNISKQLLEWWLVRCDFLHFGFELECENLGLVLLQGGGSDLKKMKFFPVQNFSDWLKAHRRFWWTWRRRQSQPALRSSYRSGSAQLAVGFDQPGHSGQLQLVGGNCRAIDNIVKYYYEILWHIMNCCKILWNWYDISNPRTIFHLNKLYMKFMCTFQFHTTYIIKYVILVMLVKTKHAKFDYFLELNAPFSFMQAQRVLQRYLDKTVVWARSLRLVLLTAFRMAVAKLSECLWRWGCDGQSSRSCWSCLQQSPERKCWKMKMHCVLTSIERDTLVVEM